MTSALTNWVTPSVPSSRAGATVDFPAPLGPATATMIGRLLEAASEFMVLGGAERTECGERGQRDVLHLARIVTSGRPR